MTGVTKHIFEHELRDILSMWNNEIKSICPLLPRKYTSNDVIVLLKPVGGIKLIKNLYLSR